MEEINEYFEKNSKAKFCGNYHIRHTDTSNRWLEFINVVELKINHFKLKKVAFIFITLSLFISGCMKKHTRGRRIRDGGFIKTEKNTEYKYAIKRKTDKPTS